MQKFITTLHSYYVKNKRDTLPWRKTKSVYHILLSEIMLQQTQVPRVLVKYKEFLEKLLEKNEHYRSGEFEVVGEIEKGKVYTTNSYGKCLSRVHDLLRGFNISIETSINKNEYFMNYFKSKNEILSEQLIKLTDYTKSGTKILWGYKFGIVGISPSEIIDKKSITIDSARDKTKFYVNQVKELRKDSEDIEYNDFKFKNFSEKGVFRCKIHNIDYRQSLSSHKSGIQGCMKCAKNITFYNDETIEYFDNVYGKFYIVRLYNEKESFYKVGITGVKGNKRKRDLKRVYNVETIYEKESYLKESYEQEKLFLNLFKDYKYTPLIDFKGKSECFEINPLFLYNDLEGFYNEDKINRDKTMCEENGIDYKQQLFTKY